MRDRILLFIPMYNCEKQIVRVLHQLTPEICRFFSEVIIVNNRSTDNGETAVQDYLEMEPIRVPVKLLRNRENYGLGGSHKVAFQYAIENAFDYVVVLHGDDQGEIADLASYLENRIYTQYDCCLGARFLKGSKLEGYSGFRTFGNRVYNILFSAVCGYRIYDLGSGLNLYSVKMLRDDFYKKYPDNLMFNYCMVMAVRQYQQKAMFFPITWKEEDQVSNVKLFDQAKRVMGMLWKYAVKRDKFLESDLRDRKIDIYQAETIWCSNGENT